MPSPLNLNLSNIVLPSDADARLVKTLFVGDSQFGQTSQRLMGQIQKWDVSFVGRYCGMENQPTIGVGFTGVSGAPGGGYGTASLVNTRVELGQDWGDGNTGNHFHHGRKFTVTGGIGTNFQELGRSLLTAGAYTRAYNRDTRKFGKIAVHATTNQAIGGGFNAARITEVRGTVSGNALDFAIPATGGIAIAGREIRQAGSLGTAGNDVGLVVRDGNGSDNDRSLHVLGTLIYDSPSGEAFPATGFLPFQISQAGWSAWDHLNTLSEAAIDAAITMAQGFDTVVIMLGHNAEDSGDFSANIAALKARIANRHVALGFPVPGFLFIAPWNINAGAGQIVRLRAQADALYALSASNGDGFINLLDFYGEAQPEGTIVTPRGSQLYTLDGTLVHPADADTAQAIAQDIEWHFNPANWFTPAGSTPSSAVFIRSEERFEFIATAPVLAGEVVISGGLFGVANHRAAVGDLVSADAFGIYDLPKASAAVFAPGAAVYWDASAGQIVAASSGNTYAGRVAYAAGSGATIVTVRIGR